MPPLGWTPEGTATWQAANESLRDYIAAKSDPPCPWCIGQGGFLRRSEELNAYVPTLCDGCFGTGTWKSGTDAKS